MGADAAKVIVAVPALPGPDHNCLYRPGYNEWLVGVDRGKRRFQLFHKSRLRLLQAVPDPGLIRQDRDLDTLRRIALRLAMRFITVMPSASSQ
jgi:hypothetical protein